MAGFLDLPREIRDGIYKLCLLVDAEIVAHPDYFETATNFSVEGVNRPAVALLRVNRQVGQEAAAVLYGSNIWRIPNHCRLIKEDRPPTVYERYGPFFRQVTIRLDNRDMDSKPTEKQFSRHIPRRPSKFDRDMARFHDNCRRNMYQDIEERASLLHNYMHKLQSILVAVDNLRCSEGCCRLPFLNNISLWINMLPAQVNDPSKTIFSVPLIRMTGLRTETERRVFRSHHLMPLAP